MHNSSEPTNESEALVRYLRLDFDLSALYAKWSQSDANFREKAAQCRWVCFVCTHSVRGFVGVCVTY